MAEAAKDYLGPEAKARLEIDRQLAECGWVVQKYRQINLAAGRGVAVREFPMEEGHGDADYLLFLDRKAVGVIEAKRPVRRSPPSSGNRPSTPPALQRPYPRS